MNKLFNKIAALSVGLAMAIGVGVAIGQTSDVKNTKAAQGDVVYVLDTNDGATSSGTTHAYTVATSTTYNNYSANDWALTCGNKSSSDPKGMWIGANNNNKARMTLGQGSYAPASAIATAIGVTTSATYYSALYQTAGALSNVGSVTITYGGTGGTAPSEAWVVYSTNNGTSWNLFGTKKTTITSGMEFTNTTVSSALYGFVIHCTAWGNLRAPVITFKEGATGGATVTGVTVTGTSTKTSYTTVDSWSNAGLTANVAMSDSSTYTGNITWSYTPDLTPAAAVIENDNDEVTGYSLTATATAGGQSGSKTTTGVSVSYATVADGLDAIPNSGDQVEGAIVQGTISYIDSIDTSTYHNATYFISDDGTRNDELEIYRGKGLNNANFTNTNDIQVGDVVLVYGTLNYYNGTTKEFLSGNYLLDLDRPASSDPSITITEANFTMAVGSSDVTLHATAENIPTGGSVKWESGTPAAATIGESTGVVHAVAPGSTVITAKIVNSSNVAVATNSITVTVVANVLDDGDTFIIKSTYDNTDYYLTGVANNLGTTSTTESEAMIFTAIEGATSGQFQFKNGSNYLSYSGSSNYLYTTTDDEADSTLWTAVNDGSAIVIESVNVSGRKLQFNYNNGNPRFVCYTSVQNPVTIEKIEAPEVDDVAVMGDATANAGGASSVTKEFLYEVMYVDSSNPGNEEVTVSVLNSSSTTAGASVTTAPSGGSFSVTFTANDTFTVTVTSVEDNTKSDSTTIVVSNIVAPSVITFDFEDEGAHRAEGTANNYTNSGNLYSENDTDITLTYADSVTTGTPISGSANITGRVAKNTTNSPVVEIGEIDISDYAQITQIDYKIKGVGSMSVTLETSVDGGSYVTQQTIAALTTSTISESVENLALSGDTLTLRWTVSVSSSTTSNRDFQLDDVVITYSTAQAYTAADFADEFLTTLSTGQSHVCVADGSTNLSSLKTAWKTLAGKWGDVSDPTSITNAVASESGNDYQKTKALYIYIAEKYNTQLEDSELTDYNFMGLTGLNPRSSARVSIFDTNTESGGPTLAIIVASIISLTAVGGYFVIRKRKFTK